MKDNPRVRGTNIQWNMAVRANCPLDQFTSDISIDSSIRLRISHLLQYMIGTLLVTVKITLKEVGEKEKLQDGEHDEQFDQYDPPQLSSPGHVLKTLVIKPECLSNHQVYIFI
jgi:hypothetical protein